MCTASASGAKPAAAGRQGPGTGPPQDGRDFLHQIRRASRRFHPFADDRQGRLRSRSNARASVQDGPAVLTRRQSVGGAERLAEMGRVRKAPGRADRLNGPAP